MLVKGGPGIDAKGYGLDRSSHNHAVVELPAITRYSLALASKGLSRVRQGH